ncbi:MAG: hypothetical protein AAGH15_06075 [Myxococcota bacterium]
MSNKHWMNGLALLALSLAVACGDDDGGGGSPDDMGMTDVDGGGTEDMGGTPMLGCTDEDAANFNPAATTDDGTCEYSVTLTVDMAGIDFDAADGVCVLQNGATDAASCTALAQDGDTSIWSVALTVPAGTGQFRFAVASDPLVIEDVPDQCTVEGSSPNQRGGTIPIPEGEEIPTFSFGACGSLPFFVDGVYSASGFIGDGETPGGIEVEVDDGTGNVCSTRVDGADGACRRWTYTPGGRGFGGVFWQFPENNFGAMPGFPIPRGTRRITFAAWGAEGGETVEFGSGVEGDVGDGFQVRDTIELTTTPTLYSVAIPGSAEFDEIVTGFLWVIGGAEAPVSFFTDNVVFESADPGAGCTNPNAANFDDSATSDDGSCEFTFELNVDMNTYSSDANGGGTCGASEDTFTEVFITGAFCGFCSDPGLRLFDEDGDGIFSQTFTFPEADFDINDGTELEFKYMVDGFINQENLVDDVMAGDAACVANTDGSAFANRGLRPTANPTVLNHVYGRCSVCP